MLTSEVERPLLPVHRKPLVNCQQWVQDSGSANTGPTVSDNKEQRGFTVAYNGDRSGRYGYNTKARSLRNNTTKQTAYNSKGLYTRHSGLYNRGNVGSYNNKAGSITNTGHNSKAPHTVFIYNDTTKLNNSGYTYNRKAIDQHIGSKANNATSDSCYNTFKAKGSGKPIGSNNANSTGSIGYNKPGSIEFNHNTGSIAVNHNTGSVGLSNNTGPICSKSNSGRCIGVSGVTSGVPQAVCVVHRPSSSSVNSSSGNCNTCRDLEKSSSSALKAGYSTLVTGDSTSNTSKSASGTGLSTLKTGNSTTRTDKCTPRTGNSEPRTNKSEPRTNTSEPRTNNSTQSTGSSSARTDNSSSGTSNCSSAYYKPGCRNARYNNGGPGIKTSPISLADLRASEQVLFFDYQILCWVMFDFLILIRFNIYAKNKLCITLYDCMRGDLIFSYLKLIVKQNFVLLKITKEYRVYIGTYMQFEGYRIYIHTFNVV